jgi:hypothetical protein
MTARQSIHAVGESEPQNTADSVKFALPAQTTSLGLLDDEEPVLWQFDEEVGLPVVSHMEHFGAMLGKYGQPDMRENGRTTTLPKTYTAYAHGGGHPQVNFTRDDVLGFFAPESKIANDFPRLYVGTYDDYQRLVRGNYDGGPPGGSTQIIWGEPYERLAFAPSQPKYVREVCIARPGEEPFRTTRPATEEWVRSEKLLGQLPTPAPRSPHAGR